MREKPPKPGTRLAIACPPECSFFPEKIGNEQAKLLMMVRSEGVGQVVFARRAEAILGYKPVLSSVSRHLKHYRALEEDPVPTQIGPKVTDLEILDGIIGAGWRNSRNWRPSIKDTLDAMKMKLSITGNSAFENMLSAMEDALQLAEGGDDDEDEEIQAPEAPEAVLSEAERSPEEVLA